MTTGRQLEIVTWDKVRKQVAGATTTKLTKLIDALSPSKKLKLIKASYRYGDLIIDHGVPFLPTHSNHMARLDDPTIPSPIRGALSYSPIPLFLTLTQSNEVFIDTGSRSVPLNLMGVGTLLGLFEFVDTWFNLSVAPYWSVSAGARTLFLLPKISDNIGLNRLRSHFELPISISLKNYGVHWNTFHHIANSSHFTQPWCNEVLFFTKEWMEKRHDKDWNAFHTYLFEQCWRQAKFAIGKIDQGLYWESYIDAIISRNLKPTPYFADQIKHLLAIAAGQWPAFVPADDSQTVAPTKGLQQAFLEVYQLKHYLPTMMHISLLQPQQETPLYYSLYHPTLLEGSPHNNSASTIMLALRNIRLLIDTIKERTPVNHFDSILKRNYVINRTEFDYFHVEAGAGEEIKPSHLIAEEDQRFLSESKQYPDRKFCATSPFWRGCIRIVSV